MKDYLSIEECASVGISGGTWFIGTIGRHDTFLCHICSIFRVHWSGNV